MKEFSFNTEVERGPNVDIIPPPYFTHMTLPFNYGYAQNPYVQYTAEGETHNTTLPNLRGHFITYEQPIPTGPLTEPDLSNTRVAEMLDAMQDAFEERPVWTRRSLLNRISDVCKTWYELRKYTHFVSYQFRSGPWKGAVIPFGTDPRTDPKYRPFQTVMFHVNVVDRGKGEAWHLQRKRLGIKAGITPEGESKSHIFDGKTYYTDAKVWQLCDITDPLLAKLLANADYRPTCSRSSGWYHGGVMYKLKAVMKIKLTAILFGKELRDSDFSSAIAQGDKTPPHGAFKGHLPQLELTREEWARYLGRPVKKNRKIKGLKMARHRVLADFPKQPSTIPQGTIPEGTTPEGIIPEAVSPQGGTEDMVIDDRLLAMTDQVLVENTTIEPTNTGQYEIDYGDGDDEEEEEDEDEDEDEDEGDVDEDDESDDEQDEDPEDDDDDEDLDGSDSEQFETDEDDGEEDMESDAMEAMDQG